jgi:cytochrome c oxidase subunit 2
MKWFTAQKKGTYDILCAEYCGQMHSYMLTTITVMDRSDYDAWLLTEPDTSNEHPGLTLLKRNACLSCHTQDGTRLVGPSFKGILGMSETVLIDGNETEIVVDRNYVIESIKNPNAAIVKGYQSGLMISYEETMSEEDLNNIIDYLETLK